MGNKMHNNIGYSRIPYAFGFNLIHEKVFKKLAKMVRFVCKHWNIQMDNW